MVSMAIFLFWIPSIQEALSYGNYTLGQIQGCTSAEDLWTLSYDSEQTLTTSFFGYNSTTVLMQSVVYELQMNYSASGVADNIQYKLYLSYETIPNSPNDYSTVQSQEYTLPSGISLNSTEPYNITGTLSIPGNGGYVCSLMLYASCPLNGGGVFNIGFAPAKTYIVPVQTQPTSVAATPSFIVSTDG